MCTLTISAYELSIAPPAFLRGYWRAYCGRPASGITSVCRVQYDRGFRAGEADRAALARMWERYSEERAR